MPESVAHLHDGAAGETRGRFRVLDKENTLCRISIMCGDMIDSMLRKAYFTRSQVSSLVSGRAASMPAQVMGSAVEKWGSSASITPTPKSTDLRHRERKTESGSEDKGSLTTV